MYKINYWHQFTIDAVQSFTFIRSTIENCKNILNYYYKNVSFTSLNAIYGMWPTLVLTTHEREWRNPVSGLRLFCRRELHVAPSLANMGRNCQLPPSSRLLSISLWHQNREWILCKHFWRAFSFVFYQIIKKNLKNVLFIIFYIQKIFLYGCTEKIWIKNRKKKAYSLVYFFY